MKIRPLSDRIVVKQQEADETTRGGIILADVSKEKPCIGTVISVGPGELHESGKFLPMEIKEGQKVLYARYGGSDVRLEGEEYTILHLSDIIGLVDP